MGSFHIIGCLPFLNSAEMEALLQPWEEGAAAQSYAITILGQPHTFCNHRYRRKDNLVIQKIPQASRE